MITATRRRRRRTTSRTRRRRTTTAETAETNRHSNNDRNNNSSSCATQLLAGHFGYANKSTCFIWTWIMGVRTAANFSSCSIDSWQQSSAMLSKGRKPSNCFPEDIEILLSLTFQLQELSLLGAIWISLVSSWGLSWYSCGSTLGQVAQTRMPANDVSSFMP